MTVEAPSDTAALSPWSALVVNDRVALGGLPPRVQRLALALVWAGLPGPGPWTEPQMNEALKTALASQGAWLATDHVELRRSLVDAGWMQRDGFGRAYEVLPLHRLAAALREAAEPLAGIDVAAWVVAQRADAARRRADRRARWEARRAAAS